MEKFYIYDLARAEDDLLVFSEKAGRVSGILEGLPEETKQEVIVDIILAEAIKTSFSSRRGLHSLDNSVECETPTN